MAFIYEIHIKNNKKIEKNPVKLIVTEYIFIYKIIKIITYKLYKKMIFENYKTYKI